MGPLAASCFMICVATGIAEEEILDRDGLTEVTRVDDRSHFLSTLNILKLLLQATTVLARLQAPQMVLLVLPQAEVKLDELEELWAEDLAVAVMAVIALDSRTDP